MLDLLHDYCFSLEKKKFTGPWYVSYFVADTPGPLLLLAEQRMYVRTRYGGSCVGVRPGDMPVW